MGSMSKEEISYKNIAEEVAQSIAGKLGENPTPHKLGRLLIDELRQRIPIRTFVQGDRVVGTYIYNGGIYVEGEKKLEGIFDTVMGLLRMEERSRRYSSFRTDFMAMIRASTYTEAEPNEGLVLYGDVVLDWDSLFYDREPYAYPPSPDLYVVHRIPWKIDLETLKKYKDRGYEEILEGFRSETRISKYYEEWADKHYPLLLELTGYCLLAGKYPLKALFVIWGDRDSGKTTFADLLVSLLGEDNVVNIPFQDLASDQKRFSRIELYQRMACIYDDLPDEVVQEVGWIKMLTGESWIYGERKFRDPIYFKNYAKLVFLCNRPPIVGKADDAFWSRVVALEFPNKFERNDGVKRAVSQDILPAEAPKLLAFALLAVKHAVVRGEFSFQDTPEDAKRKWMRRADSVFHFVETGREEGWLVEEEGVREEAPFLYDLYVRFCASEMIDEVSRRKFTERMAELGHMGYPEKGKRYYKGIRVVRDKLPDHLRGSTGLE
jgi:putative DNA primase/helicase